MPADNIKRAIRRGTGEDAGRHLRRNHLRGLRPRRRGAHHRDADRQQEPHRRRTAPHARPSRAATSANRTAVAWMFDKKGYIVVEKAKADEDTLMAAVLDAGADDMRDDGDNWEVVCAPATLRSRARSGEGARRRAGQPPQIAMLPQNYVKLEGKPAQQMVQADGRARRPRRRASTCGRTSTSKRRRSRPRWREDLRDRSRLRSAPATAASTPTAAAIGSCICGAIPRHRRRHVSRAAARSSTRSSPALIAECRPDCVVIENPLPRRRTRAAR